MRFLSELEAGRGNISIARLAKVANALQVPLDRLLIARDETTNGGSRSQLAAELAMLDDSDVEETLVWLRSRRAAGRRFEKAALVGLRGAGKTTLGKAVAKKLRIAFIELDKEIEDAAGMPLSDIFGFHGEPHYRRLEHDQLKAVLQRKGRAVIATGGGIVTASDTYELLRRSCYTVWLEASPEDHWQRVVAQGDHRPMKGKPQAMADLRSILAARRELYARAHARIDTSVLGHAEAVAELARRVAEAAK